MKYEIIKTDNYLLVVDESEIKEGNFVLSKFLVVVPFGKNYNPTLYKKIIAHLPLNGSPILEGVDLLPQLENEVDVEKKAHAAAGYPKHDGDREKFYIKGYNQALEDNKDKKYTEEDIDKAYWAGMQFVGEDKGSYKEFIQSLSQAKMPIGFECAMLDTGKFGVTSTVPMKLTTITHEGHTQWVGKYILN